ncbi:hypothetical protein [Nocardioides sp.]|uniref:hypothetical protein n=1 Tax=Nocardioides sp. TaxID=35761 RepID=UPI0039E2A2AE
MTTTASPTGTHISENVATLLWRASMSQRNLSATTGLAQATITAKMRGDSTWTVLDLERIGEVLYVTVQELVGSLPEREEWEQRRSTYTPTRW